MNEDKLGYSYSYDLKDGIVKVKDFVKIFRVFSQ